LIVEAASGESYSDYIQQHIFDPLEMSHSYTSKAVAQQNGLAMGHRYWFGHPFPAPHLSIPPGSLPAGELISSAEDMAHYLIANLNGGRYDGAQILSEAGIDELHRPAAEINEMGLSLGDYGMGWISQEIGESRIVSHSGIVPDFGAAPWAMRGMLLIPLLQIAGVATTLLLLRRWRLDPERRPSRGRMWGQHILLPLIPNLLVALTLIPMLSKMRGFLMLFMPEFS
jgi:CubicO group peptidase (beta-lactamase class C family)